MVREVRVVGEPSNVFAKSFPSQTLEEKVKTLGRKKEPKKAWVPREVKHLERSRKSLHGEVLEGNTQKIAKKFSR